MSICTRCSQEIQEGEAIQFVNPGQADPDSDVAQMDESAMEPQHVECPE